jgi:hypothetical protein
MGSCCLDRSERKGREKTSLGFEGESAAHRFFDPARLTADHAPTALRLACHLMHTDSQQRPAADGPSFGPGRVQAGRSFPGPGLGRVQAGRSFPGLGLGCGLVRGRALCMRWATG